MLLSVLVLQVCQRCARQFTAVDMCTVRQMYVVRQSVHSCLKVSCAVVMETMAGLHGADEQNSIPGGDRNSYTLPRSAVARTS
jgi:hypothetical protein